MTQKITATGSLFYSFETKRFLLLHRTDNKPCWGLVGGKTEEGETPWQGLQREIQEEIRFDDKIIKTIPLETFVSNDDKFHFHTYLCIVKNEFVPILNDEHDGWAWVSYNQWPKPLHVGLTNTLRSRVSRTKLETVLTLIDELLEI